MREQVIGALVGLLVVILWVVMMAATSFNVFESTIIALAIIGLFLVARKRGQQHLG